MKTIKYAIMTLCAALFIGACSDQEGPSVEGPAEELIPISLNVGMDGGFRTGSSFEPMTRAESYATYISPYYDCLILKKIGNDWVVERNASIRTTGGIIPASGQVVKDYRIELTPGHYHMLIVLNKASGMNGKLIPGYRIPDAPTLATGYSILDSSYWEGALHSTYEVFAGTAEFDVIKSDRLADAPDTQAVDVTVTRRVGTIGVYLGQTSEVERQSLEGSVGIHLVSDGQPFCEGIDVFGKPYYSPEGLHDFYGNFWISSRTAEGNNGNRYYFPLRFTRTSGHFFFTDPDKEVPFTVDYVTIGYGQSGPNYTYDVRGFSNPNPVVSGTLRHNRTCHLTFLDSGYEIETYHNAMDPEYFAEDAADLFPPDFMWTTDIE